MSAPPSVVYIACAEHSGSTLLDLLISAHSQVVSVGEVDKLVRRPNPGCSCDRESVWDCPFWAEVDRAFRVRTGAPLREARLLGPDDRDLASHDRALFEAVSEVTGARVVVDSSKSLARLERLLETRAVGVYPIHLVRRCQGVTYSNMRKGRSWAGVSFRHGRKVGSIERFLADRPHVSVRYEELVADPTGTLGRVMGAIGLRFEPGQLRWAEHPRHNCEGNRMRRSTDSTIRPDRAWEATMPAWQKLLVAALAGAGRVSAPFPGGARR